MKRSSINWSLVRSIFLAVGSIVTVSTLVYLAANWIQSKIDSAIERKLSDPFILRQIAAQSRPMIVFDSRESILADLGGAQFIKRITVTPDDKDPQLPRCSKTGSNYLSLKTGAGKEIKINFSLMVSAPT